MNDHRIWRTDCPFCNKRVTVGAANRIYKHKNANGKLCDGWAIKIERPVRGNHEGEPTPDFDEWTAAVMDTQAAFLEAARGW